MNLRGLSEHLARSFCSYGKVSFQLFQGTLKNITVLSSTPDNIQRISNLASALIEGVGLYYKKECLPKFKRLLEIASLTDFFNLIQFPCNFLYPIKPHLINEYDLLNQLENLLCKKLKINSIETIRPQIKEILRGFLEISVEEDNHYLNEQEFIVDLKNYLIEQIPNHQLPSHVDKVNLEKIDFFTLKLSLKKKSIWNVLSRISFLFYDVGTPINFLNQWDVISLSKVANTIGKHKFLSWIPNQSFEKWVTGSYVTGFVFQLIEAGKVLANQQSTKIQREQAYWDVALATSEIFLNTLSIIEGSRILIIGFTFVAKTIGIISTFKKPSLTFFDVKG